MKKLLATVLILSMGTLFAGCSSQSPTDVADAFLQSVKSGDNAGVQAVYAGEFDEPSEGEEDTSPAANLLSEVESLNDDSDDSAEDSTSDEVEEVTEDDEAFQALMTEKMTGYDYTISNEKIDGDKATVDVAITTYDLGSATTQSLGEYLQQALGLAFAGASEEYMTDLLEDLMSENYEAVTEKDYTETVSLNLVKVNDEWKVADVSENEEALDAMFGGIINALTNFQDAFSWSDESNADSGNTEDDILYTNDESTDAESVA